MPHVRGTVRTSETLDVVSDRDELRRSFDSGCPTSTTGAGRGYPPALFDDLFALLPERPPLRLEVGPGTGAGKC